MPRVSTSAKAHRCFPDLKDPAILVEDSPIGMNLPLPTLGGEGVVSKVVHLNINPRAFDEALPEGFIGLDLDSTNGSLTRKSLIVLSSPSQLASESDALPQASTSPNTPNWF